MVKKYYRRLQIYEDATKEEIRKAYKKLMLKYHPDKNPNPSSKEKCIKIQAAYNELMSNRVSYDRMRSDDETESSGDEKTQQQQQEFTRKETRCGAKQANFRYPYYRKEHTPEKANKYWKTGNLEQDPAVEHDLEITLEEILNGCTKTIKIMRRELSENELYFCKKEKKFEINVEPGLKAGSRIIFRKAGDQSKYRIPADVIFIIREKPHLYFTRDGSNIKYTCELTYEKTFGKKVEIPTLTDEMISILFTNDIKPNTIRRFSGNGLPCRYHPTQRGDLIVTFKMKIPD